MYDGRVGNLLALQYCRLWHSFCWRGTSSRCFRWKTQIPLRFCIFLLVFFWMPCPCPHKLRRQARQARSLVSEFLSEQSSRPMNANRNLTRTPTLGTNMGPKFGSEIRPCRNRQQLCSLSPSPLPACARPSIWELYRSGVEDSRRLFSAM